jgi:hypothetical protein
MTEFLQYSTFGDLLLWPGFVQTLPRLFLSSTFLSSTIFSVLFFLKPYVSAHKPLFIRGLELPSPNHRFLAHDPSTAGWPESCGFTWREDRGPPGGMTEEEDGEVTSLLHGLKASPSGAGAQVIRPS